MKAPYSEKLFKKHVFLYIAVQVVLWIKVLLFYNFFGQGILMRLSEPFYTLAPFLSPEVFTSNLLVFDYLFHQTVHVAIWVLIAIFAAKAVKLKFKHLLALTLIANVLHNVGYWITNSFTDFDALLLDFVQDGVLLILFFYALQILYTTAVGKKFKKCLQQDFKTLKTLE